MNLKNYAIKNGLVSLTKGKSLIGKLFLTLILIGLIFGSISVSLFSNPVNSDKINYAIKRDSSNSEADLLNKPPSLSLSVGSSAIELGETPYITVEITNITNIKKVYLEYEGSNHSMQKIPQNDTWYYDKWTPSSVGIYLYTVWVVNKTKIKRDFWNYTSGTIEVIDTTAPSYSHFKEIKDPLELGKNIKISLKAIDFSGINQVLVEYEDSNELSNHSMTHLRGDNWKYDSWTPESIGTYYYKIYIEDNNDNLKIINESLQVVIDATPPSYETLELPNEVKAGEKIDITIKVQDFYGIKQVLFEFKNYNYSMVHIFGTEIWHYELTAPKSSGIYSYEIHMEDIYNNWNHTAGSFEAINTNIGGETPNTLWTSTWNSIGWIIILTLIPLSLLVGIIGVKKIKTRENRLKRKIPERIQFSRPMSILTDTVDITCPVCKTSKKINMSKLAFLNPSGISTVSIPKNLVCDHQFLVYVDNEFLVRGYESVDFEFETES